MSDPNVPLLIAAAVAIYFYFLWRTVVVCLQFRWWVLPLVLLIDHAVIFSAPYPVVFAGWKLWFFWAMFRWEPVRGLFRAPRWPRSQHLRGPGRRRRREFSEPMPWQVGPLSSGQ